MIETLPDWFAGPAVFLGGLYCIYALMIGPGYTKDSQQGQDETK